MGEEEKEELLKASDFLYELGKSGYKYSCYGREIYIRDNVFRVIDKLQKENQELKEETTQLKGVLKHFEQLIKENEKLKKNEIIAENRIAELQEENKELEKTIELIIDDFQAENYFVGMTNKEIREYYKKRIKEVN